jgi:hypothetical protein
LARVYIEKFSNFIITFYLNMKSVSFAALAASVVNAAGDATFDYLQNGADWPNDFSDCGL